jgi:hypothetical protein
VVKPRAFKAIRLNVSALAKPTTSKNVSISPRIEPKYFNNITDLMTQITVSDETLGAIFFSLHSFQSLHLSAQSLQIFLQSVVCPVCPEKNKNNNLRETISKTRGQVSQVFIRLRYVCWQFCFFCCVVLCVFVANRGLSIGRTQEIIIYLQIIRNINLQTFN